jgi:hypothetical protein
VAGRWGVGSDVVGPWWGGGAIVAGRWGVGSDVVEPSCQFGGAWLAARGAAMAQVGVWPSLLVTVGQVGR